LYGCHSERKPVVILNEAKNLKMFRCARQDSVSRCAQHDSQAMQPFYLEGELEREKVDPPFIPLLQKTSRLGGAGV
jgi:hypothetical protein